MRRHVLLGFLIAGLAGPGGARAQASSIVVVRHAEKTDTTRDPELSAAGMARAEALRGALAAFALQGIFVSEYRRTAQTATPTPEAFHLTPTGIPIQGDKLAQAAATAAAIQAMAPGSAALVIGHSKLGHADVDCARAEGASLIYLETNSSLVNVIRLYRRLGFEHAARPTPSEYARADACMELRLR